MMNGNTRWSAPFPPPPPVRTATATGHGAAPSLVDMIHEKMDSIDARLERMEKALRESTDMIREFLQKVAANSKAGTP
ncbi:MAG: hypothetical protein LBF61_02670 [Azoarcus sp.]|jgi:hypothetical protein|nr:hypothetical protein [Azoarcus sp.]